jgi:hypothetical protein
MDDDEDGEDTFEDWMEFLAGKPDEAAGVEIFETFYGASGASKP